MTLNYEDRLKKLGYVVVLAQMMNPVEDVQKGRIRWIRWDIF